LANLRLRMRQYVLDPGALGHLQAHKMLASSAFRGSGIYLQQFPLMQQLRHHALNRLHQLAPTSPHKYPCAATRSTSLHFRSFQACQASIAACSVPAAGHPCFRRLQSSSLSGSSGFPWLEPASTSNQHGLRRSVRLKALGAPEKGHCGENGLVKGAGVVRSPPFGVQPLCLNALKGHKDLMDYT
jgi:hypothetical protein